MIKLFLSLCVGCTATSAAHLVLNGDSWGGFILAVMAVVFGIVAVATWEESTARK